MGPITLEKILAHTEYSETTGCRTWRMWVTKDKKPVWVYEDGVLHGKGLHRVVYEFTHKVLLNRDQWVYRTCGNKLCLEPSHLVMNEPGTMPEHMKDEILRQSHKMHPDSLAKKYRVDGRVMKDFLKEQGPQIAPTRLERKPVKYKKPVPASDFRKRNEVVKNLLEEGHTFEEVCKATGVSKYTIANIAKSIGYRHFCRYHE